MATSRQARAHACVHTHSQSARARVHAHVPTRLHKVTCTRYMHPWAYVCAHLPACKRVSTREWVGVRTPLHTRAHAPVSAHAGTRAHPHGDARPRTPARAQVPGALLALLGRGGGWGGGWLDAAAPLQAAVPEFRAGLCLAAGSPPPGSFTRLFSPLPPGREPSCHCLPRTLGLGTCSPPGWQPFASSTRPAPSARARLFLRSVCVSRVFR